MKLAVFSDLHLAPDATNQCTASAEELAAWCGRIEARADRVLIGGDLFNLDRAPLPGAWRGQIARLQDAMPRVYDQLTRYEWIYGNHDAALERQGVPERRRYEGDRVSILTIHGHQFDMWLKKLPGLAPAANFVAGWLERAGLTGVASAMGRVPLLLDRLRARLVSPTDNGDDRGLLAARSLVERGEAEVVVSGHSHLLRLVPCAGGLFVNTGSVTRGHLDWALVDTDAARVDAFRDGTRVQRAEKRGDRWIVEGRADDVGSYERAPL